MVTNHQAEAALFIGQLIAGRYEILGLIGLGGFGYVFEARDNNSHRSVAIKILQLGAPPPAAVEFGGECEILSMLAGASSVVDSYGNGEHPLNIATPGGASATIPAQYVVLELADACLAELLANRQNLAWSDRLRLFRGVVRGVHQMHLNKIVHRDLKSDNVLLLPNGGTPVAKVSDFGRSRILSRAPRWAPDDYLYGRGDLRFAPPEVLWLLGTDSETFWRRVDLYHLGSVLYELATGQGVTSVALGNPAVILNRVHSMSPDQRTRDFTASMPSIRTRFDLAVTVFKGQLPPAIRDEAVRLVTQLCNPESVRREFQFRGHFVRDLQWLIRRVDILLLLLSTSARRHQYRRKAV